MIKKLLVLMAAAGLVSFACFTVLAMMGGFQAINNFGPWGDWRDGGRDPGPETTRNLAYTGGPRLDIYYPAEITYTQGDQPRFTVTGPQYLLDQLRLDNDQLMMSDGPRNRPRFRWNRRYNGRLRIDMVSSPSSSLSSSSRYCGPVTVNLGWSPWV